MDGGDGTFSGINIEAALGLATTAAPTEPAVVETPIATGPLEVDDGESKKADSVKTPTP